MSWVYTFCSVVTYIACLLPGSLLSLRSCHTKSLSSLHHWLQFLLLWNGLHVLLFPALDPLLHLFPYNMWYTVKFVVLVGLVLPKSPYVSRTFDFMERHYEEYGYAIMTAAEQNLVKPLKHKVAQLIQKFPICGKKERGGEGGAATLPLAPTSNRMQTITSATPDSGEMKRTCGVSGISTASTTAGSVGLR